MIGIHFTKQRAEHFIDSLANGKGIESLPGGWKGHDLLSLAGACFATAFSQGPAKYQETGIADLHPERQEFVKEQFTNDLLAAIEFYSMLTFRVIDGEYDSDFEPEVQAIVERDGDTRKVFPGKGCPQP